MWEMATDPMTLKIALGVIEGGVVLFVGYAVFVLGTHAMFN